MTERNRLTDPTTTGASPELHQLRQRIAVSIGVDADDLHLLTATTADEIANQARAARAARDQHGTTTPATPTSDHENEQRRSVEAGRRLYRDGHRRSIWLG